MQGDHSCCHWQYWQVCLCKYLVIPSNLKLQSQSLVEGEESFVSKEFTLEAIVQVARSLGTKSLDKNQIFNLSVAVTNTDLKPLYNNCQRIKHQFRGVNAYKAIWTNRSEYIENHFSWKSTGKVFPKGPVRSDKATVKIKRGGSNRITISRKMFNAERKKLTQSNCVGRLSPVNIL
jgi:hypothetical protein